MTTTLEPRKTTPAGQDRNGYARLSLVELAARIANCGDRDALRELHDERALFRIADSRPLRLAAFVDGLCRRRARTESRQALLDRAYDLTIDKFTHLPAGQAGTRPEGPDCRCYFRCFLRQCRRWHGEHPRAHPLQAEAAARGILTRLVVRHFRLSCAEANRCVNPARTRYVWRVNGGAISLWMPAHLAGAQRGAWLAAHVDEPDPRRVNERVRVQEIVDRSFGHMRHLPLDERDDALLVAADTGPPIEDDVFAHGLASVVAHEKANTLDRQRPAIRSLGPGAVHQLVLRILGDLEDGCYEEKAVAAQFGLSPATLSRFAGSRWRLGPARRPPDLWLNVAQTLALHETFVDAAREAGVWDNVETLLAEHPTHSLAEVDHER